MNLAASFIWFTILVIYITTGVISSFVIVMALLTIVVQNILIFLEG